MYTLALLLLEQNQRKEGTRESSQPSTPAVPTAGSHRALGCFFHRVHVRCVSQDCQHISAQREPYRNTDICGVKGRQLARTSLEEAEDGEERRGDCQQIIREVWTQMNMLNLNKSHQS